MKRKIWILLAAVLLAVLLPLGVWAQGDSLEDYVDMDHLDRYLKEQVYSAPYAGARTEVELREFEIPAWLEDELYAYIYFNIPEIIAGRGWWLSSGSDYVTQLVFFPGRNLDAIRATADMLVHDIRGSDSLTDLEKALLVHDRLALWADYDFACLETDLLSSTVYDALVRRLCVCSGYAHTYQYLLAKVGVYSEYHSSGIMNHAWNGVWIDGQCYMVDVTWDDRGGHEVINYSYPIVHDYFMAANNRNEVAGVPPYAAYSGVWWPNIAYLVDGEVYGVYEGELYRFEGTERIKVEIPGKEYVFAGEPALGIGDKLLCSGFDWLYTLDPVTGEEEDLGWSADEGIRGMEYQDGRVVCLVGDAWVYPFAEMTDTVTFQDWNGTVLQTGAYEYGQLVRPPEEPIRSGYVFTGWDKSVDVCTEDAVYTAQYSPCVKPSGWGKENGKWHYFVNDRKKTGWHKENNQWYYLNYAGVMETGLYELVTKVDVINKESAYYYFDNSGVMKTGWQKLDGIWYYFNPSGEAATMWKKLGGRWYFFNLMGEMKTGWFYDSGKEYYLDESVGMVTGWKKLPGTWGDTWYYFGADGDRAEGWELIGGKWYYFDPSYGEMRTGWFGDNGRRYYLRDSGEMATGWQKINAFWYYFDSDGQYVTGLRQIGGKWYYFGTESYDEGQMLTHRMLEIDGKSYYFDDSGEMLTGWRKVGSDWEYFDKNGAQVTGWQKIDNVWYYFGKGTYDNVMFTGFRTIDGVTYYFGSNGAMRTGWIRIPGVIYNADGTRSDAWCYASSSGAIRYGWQKLGGKWYYFNDSSGYMCTGRRKIDGKWYTFDENGALIS